MFYFNKSKFIHKNGMYIFYDDGLSVNDVISSDSWSPVVSYLFVFCPLCGSIYIISEIWPMVM